MNLDLNQAVSSDNEQVESHVVPALNMDVARDQKETKYSITRAAEYWGYFNAIGDLQSAFIMKAIWNVGKGYKTDPKTEFVLDRIDGWGKESFNDILFNMEVCRHVFGDAFAEIIRGEDGELLNLKVLDPAIVDTIVNNKGRIIRYEVRLPFSKTPEKYMPQEIFHLTNKRFGSQIHGISDIDALEKTILADDQSFEELQKIISFQAKPFIIFKMKTDDEAKIDAFVAKVRIARSKGNDMFIPDDENLLSWEVVQVNPSQILMEWRNETRNKFYRIVGMPLILFGSSGSTESGGKIEYLGHEQVFENDQRYLERQIWNQLAKKIDLNSPTSLIDNLQTDEQKDANQGLEIQPSDTKAGVGR